MQDPRLRRDLLRRAEDLRATCVQSDPMARFGHEADGTSEPRSETRTAPVISCSPRILIIDDEPDILGLLDLGLSAAGFEVHGATTAAEFLSKYREIMPDLCVVDVTLPDADGFGLVRSLRQDDGVGIVMLSGHSGETDRGRGRDLGIDDYITKPFRMRDVVARLHAVLHRRAQPMQDDSDRAARDATDTDAAPAPNGKIGAPGPGATAIKPT